MKLITDLQKEENMTREEANKALPTLQAFAEGKVIQMLDDRSIWTDLTEREGLPIGTLGESPNIFRIKPAPKYRPFKDAKECWQEMRKHEPFGWVKIGDWYCTMREIRPTSAFCHGGGDVFHYEDMVEQITFVDGTPFGIRKEV